MINRQDSIFWANFDDLVKKTSKLSTKRYSIETKSKINELFNVTCFALFQYQLIRNESLVEINLAIIEEIISYVIKNYHKLFLFTYQSRKAQSRFSEILTDEEKKFIAEMIEQIIIPYISDNGFKTHAQILKNSRERFNIASRLAFVYEYDLTENKTNKNKITFGLPYPFFLTMVLIDTNTPHKLQTRVSTLFKFENIKRSLQIGRELSREENEAIREDIQILRNEEEFFNLINSFEEKNWAQADLNKKFKLIFQLSKYVCLFLRTRMDNITKYFDEDEILGLVHNYLPLLLSDKINNTVQLDTFEEKKSETHPALTPNLIRDIDAYQQHVFLEGFKGTKKVRFEPNKLIHFVESVKYVSNYMELIHKIKLFSPTIFNFLISNKKIALVNTLKMFEVIQEKDGSNYQLKYSNVNFNMINLDHKNWEKLLRPANRFEEIAIPNAEITILLKMISLTLALDPPIARYFDHSWTSMVKYYIIAFGPYEKNKYLIDYQKITDVENKINKLFTSYKILKDKEKVIDSVYLVYELNNFKN